MINLLRQRNVAYVALIATGVLGVGAGLSLLQLPATAQDKMVDVPIFEVDPLWPKPLPNEGLLGMTIGVSVDDRDNVWITHRGSQTLNNNEKGAELTPPTAACCRAAPPVLQALDRAVEPAPSAARLQLACPRPRRATRADPPRWHRCTCDRPRWPATRYCAAPRQTSDRGRSLVDR